MRLAATIGLALLAAGCATTEAPKAAAAIITFSQADADRISDDCGADRAWLRVGKHGEVTYQPAMDSAYEVSVCVLQKIKNSGVAKFGFVGNEKHRAEDD